MISSEDNGAEEPCIRKAEPDDIDTAEKLLAENFSSLTGCLPDREELIRDISCGGVLLYGDIGLLHHKTAKNKTELRHLCVSESARGQGIGEKLVLAYHSLTDGMRRNVWVREDFTPAKNIYEKCGYTADGMISHVLVSR
jgi:GNAT superfamily N-acetyltransferase